MKTFLMLFSFVFVGCVGAPTKNFSIVETKLVKKGMKVEQAMEMLGRPDKIKNLQDGRFIFVYSEIPLSRNSDDTQDLILLVGADGSIEAAEYGPIIKQRSSSGSGAAAFQSIGNAISGPETKTTNCTSKKDYFGNIQTQCTGN